MQTTTFDRHAAVRTLKAAGFDAVRAKAIVDIVLQSGGENVAKKADLAAAMGKLRAECTVRPSGRLAAADEKRREKVPDLCRAALMVGICTGLGVGFCIVRYRSPLPAAPYGVQRRHARIVYRPRHRGGGPAGHEAVLGTSGEMTSLQFSVVSRLEMSLSTNIGR